MDQLSEFLATPAGMAVAGLAGLLLGWVFIGFDNRVEERRREAIELAGKLHALGLQEIPRLFEDYAVGDYNGLLRGMRDLKGKLADPAQRAVVLERALKALLTDLMRDPEKRPMLLKLVEDLKAAHLPDARAVIGESIGQLMNQRTIFDEIGDGQTLFGKLVRSFLPKAEPAPPPAASPDRPAATAAHPPPAG